MPLESGSRLGSYEIASLLGKGGMGEVYRARDTKLGREVAIKVLPEDVARDPDRLARFEREARVLASLNHPSIATLHGAEQDGDTHFLVMELVEGETLADRLARGPIPVDEAIPIFRRIAEGLEAAHDRGVVHRDLKPANIKLGDGPASQPKILDFGLAKALAPDVGNTDDPALSVSPTLTLAATQRGEILGTAAYMSPEQASGEAVDKRTDIWAFGVCLWETLTGRRLFDADKITHILASVLRDEPDLALLPPATPPSVERLLRRCLHKDPHQRLRDIGDARITLAEADDEPAAISSRPRSRLAPFAAAFALGLATLLLGLWLGRETAPSGEARAAATTRAQLTLPEGVRVLARTQLSLAISDDGRRVAAVGWQGGSSRLWTRDLDDSVWNPVPDSEGAVQPFFSPDARWIGYFAAGELRKAPIDGGPAIGLAPASDPRGGSWGRDGSIVFVPTSQSKLLRVAEEGGVAEPYSAGLAGMTQSYPRHLASGELLYTVRPLSAETPEPGARFQIHALSPTGQDRLVVEDANWAQPLQPGYLLLSRVAGFDVEAPVWASRLDDGTLRATGPAEPALDGVASVPGLQRHTIAASENGNVLYATRTVPELVRVAADGTEVPATRDHGLDLLLPRLSPDGRQVVAFEGLARIWVIDLQRGSRTLVVGGDPEDGPVWGPIWSPDGRHLAFGYSDGADFDVVRRRVTGEGEIEVLFEDPGMDFPTSWSVDDEIAYHVMAPETGFDQWVLTADREPVPIATSPAWEAGGTFSADGRWLAYVSNGTGRFEIYLQPYPPTGAVYTVSTDGGQEPAWSRDGRELFYRRGDEVLSVAVTVDADGQPGLGEPARLFEARYDASAWPHLANYDVAENGELIMLTDTSVEHLELILDVQAELERLLPSE